MTRHRTSLLGWLFILLGVAVGVPAVAQEAPPTPQPGTLQFSQGGFSTTENAGQATIVVTRSGGSSGAVSVQVNTSDGSARAGQDYLPVTTVLTWEDGDALPKTFTVPIRDNAVVDEPADRTVILTLSNPAGGATLGSPSSATLTIVDDDQLAPGTLQFSQAEFTVSETAGQATISVTRTGGSGGPASVQFATSNGTATAGEDYTAVSGTLSWANGEAVSKAFTVPILQDTLVEGDETVQLTLSTPSGATLGTPSTATLTITDATVSPLQVGFTQNNFVVAEGSEPATVSVQLVGAEALAAGFQVSVIFSTSDGTAVAGRDYQATTQVLNFNANQLSQEVSIPIIRGDGAQPDRTVNLGLSSAVGSVGGRALIVAINPASATLTIASDVPETAALSIVSGQGQGGVPGTTLAPFVVAVTRSAGEPVSGVEVTWSVSPQQAGILERAQTSTNELGQASNTLVINDLTLILVTASVPGLTPVQFLVSGGLAGVTGLDEVAAPTASALDKACPAIGAIPQALRTPGQQQLLDTCNLLISGQAGPLNSALRELAPTEVAAQGKFATAIANTNLSNVETRILALRGATAGVNLSGLNLNYGEQSLSGSLFNSLFPGGRGGGASADEGSRFGNWGVFLNGTVSFGDSDTTTRESGFSFDTAGLTTGADYRFSDQFVLGGAFTYASQSSDFDASAGKLDVTGYHFNVYGLYNNHEIYYNDAFYIDAIASFGWNDYETNRRITLGSFTESADGDTSGDEYAFSLGVRYKVDQGSFTFGPYGRASYIRADIDGYQERAADGTTSSGVLLAIDKQKVDSLTTALGAEASYSFDTPYGVFSPHLRFDWTRQFLDDGRFITSRFLNDPTLTSFAVPTDDPDRNYFNLGIGAKAAFARRISGFFYYQAPLGLEGLSQHAFAAGVRMEFE